MPDKVVIITLNYNQNQYTIDCIDSLLKSNYSSFQVLLIDNGSTHENVNELSKALPDDDRLIFQKISINQGYVKGINFGLKQSVKLCPEYLLIMNNDTIVDENMISKLVYCQKKHSNKCIVSGKVFDYDNRNRIQTTGSNLSNKKLLLYKHIGSGEIDNGQFEKECERDLLDDVFWLFHRDLYDAIGGYDSAFYFNGESADFATRALKYGYRLIYCPSARIWHKGSLSVGGRNNNPFISYWNIRSKLIFRYLHLNRKNFVKFNIRMLYYIMLGYLKNIKALLTFRQPTFSVSYAALKGLFDFYSISKKEIDVRSIDKRNN